MTNYTIVTQSNESTVVAEYTASPVRSDAYQSEADLEREFIALLTAQGYEYLPIHTEADLIANLRRQLEALNGIRFTDSEWKRFFSVHIANANESITEKTRKIQEGDSRINFKRDDGLSKNIALINKADIHANRLQVINQYENDAGTYKNRYDVTVLVNGASAGPYRTQTPRRGNTGGVQSDQPLPARKFLGGKRAVRVCADIRHLQRHAYQVLQQHHAQQPYPRRQKAQSAGRQRTGNSFEFTSFWADANNRIIPDLIDFTKTFFSRHTLLNILTKYCVFSSENMLLVMRPYQIAATEKILNKIEVSHNYKQYGTLAGGGYIWHTERQRQDADLVQNGAAGHRAPVY